MKRVAICILAHICVIVSSCQKSPQDLLIGTWEMSQKTTYTFDDKEVTKDGLDYYYYTFYTNGDARMVFQDSSFSYTYVFDTANNTIILFPEAVDTEVDLIVEKLTEDTLIFHTSSKALVGYTLLSTTITMNGRKIE